MHTIIGNTTRLYEKEKNGDHLIYKDLYSEDLLLAAVADGISRKPCDGKASQQVCEQLTTPAIIRITLRRRDEIQNRK